MRAGPLRQRVSIQVLSETRDQYGQKIQHWSPGGTFWADLMALAGREAVNAKQVNAAVTHAVTMRYVGSLFAAPGILPSMRLLLGPRVFNILWVNDVDNRRREYQLLVQEVATPIPT